MRTTLMGACAGLFALGAACLPANAEHGRNAAIAGGAAAGLAAGVIAGGALASQPSYYGGPYAPGPAYAPGPVYGDDCRIIRHRVWVEGYGWQFRREEVCD
ncbi:MAG: hypothetical protein JO124_00610 [Hyphomicrobiales bacterium]|nr:hypothetical protein [Hyphomicrobiales bacterium]MBV9051888.1 hypothetical protein [Hyphomicrobiales bacterium]MBV9974640.1 hypothetical protein [Hyphomicrobiales bacterium]